MKVSDAMTTHPITVRRDDSVANAARTMLEHNISGLAVVDAASNVVGVITEADIMRRAETDTARHHSRWSELFLSPGRLANEYVQANARKVEDAMTCNAVSIDENMPLAEGVSAMEKFRVKRLPVTRGGKLCGMLSRSDLMRAFFQKQEELPTSVVLSDADIRAVALNDINKYAWAPGVSLHVSVKNGRATLTGCVTDERVRQALRVVVENVPGIRDVDDELVTIEPMTGAVVHLPAQG